MMTKEIENKETMYKKIEETKSRSNSVVWAALKEALLWKKLKKSNKTSKKVKNKLNKNFTAKIEKQTPKSKFSEFDKSAGTVDALKQMLGVIDVALDKDFLSELKDFKTLNNFEMRNGIYSAVIKEKTNKGCLVSIGKVNLDDKTVWDNWIVSVDYFIKDRDIDWSLEMWDELDVSLFLNEENGGFLVNQFNLIGWNKYFVDINNVVDKWVFINTWIYKSFISNDQLKRAGYSDKLNKGDTLLVKLKSIWQDKKQVDKKRLNIALISKTYKGKKFPSLKFVDNKKNPKKQKPNLKKTSDEKSINVLAA